MTATDAPRPTPWYGRPRTLLPLLLGFLVLAALLTPEAANQNFGDARLTTRESTPAAASLAAELPRALGWRVGENTTDRYPERTDMVHVVLGAPEPMRPVEVHQLLERVRAGAGLLVMITREHDLLADSLHLGVGAIGELEELPDVTDHCPKSAVPRLPWLRNGSARYASVRFRGPPPARVDTLLRLDAADTVAGPVLAGFAYGRGRIVASADADIFRNDELRQCEPGLGVPYLRALEYLRDSGTVAPRSWLLFDEYHQGYGAQPGTVRAVTHFFADTASGHVVAQLAFAGLLLLAFRAPRLVPPAPDQTDERRSPIEHVDALARAYVQVGATKTATQRLVRGLRRRTERSAARGATSLSDEAFLDRAAARAPAAAASATLVKRALAQGHPPREFTAVGDAIATIEHTLRQDSR
ncbi:MAG: hypothetical protein HY275_08310 [Gemmatimonadetes bacterium]|nr:hypothetical protein [Gemmatimonadota bacterium]